MKIQLTQINSIVGDIKTNGQKVIDLSKQAFEDKSDCLVFPELFLTGYPPEDLLLRADFITQVDNTIKIICAQSANIPIILGSVLQQNNQLFNVALLINNKKVQGVYKKQILPNNGVFDERRYFSAGKEPFIFKIKDKSIAVVICEDVWDENPIKQSCDNGAELIISIHASPFEINKHNKRQQILKKRIKENKKPIIYLNTIGGQDELVFDGGSMFIDSNANITTQLPFFEQISQQIDTNSTTQIITKPINNLETIYQALVLSTKDYIKNNNFNGALIGLSGGIDSALVLTIANDAIGAENIETIMMPSPYTSQESINEALQQAKDMGIKHSQINIKDIMDSFAKTLEPFFANSKVDTTEENIQARIRGVLLMALSNKTNNTNKGAKMVLTTGNKSEIAVGYATLYGDMCGGFAPLKDVPKTLVYQLANYRNTITKNIPEFVITRPPSAELRADQTDLQSLPNYDILDEILRLFIEERTSIKDIVKKGFKKDIVQKMVSLVLQNEYKRRQSAPGPKITSTAFGRERRYPITSKYQP